LISTMSDVILAIDPGLSTGVALRSNGTLTTTTLHSNEAVWALFNKSHVNVVVIERFATAGRLSSPGLATIELVGSIKGICYIQGILLHVHVPQFRYAWMDRAKALLQGVEAHTVHEVDALAHLLAYEAKGR
jgi:hypothetical protein